MEHTMYENLKENYMLNKKNRPTIWAIYFFHLLQIKNGPKTRRISKLVNDFVLKGPRWFSAGKCPKLQPVAHLLVIQGLP